MSDFEPRQSGISRRTVTKAMAWAVPAVAVAAAVPVVAASPTCLDSGLCFSSVRIEKYCAGSIPTGREYWACITFINTSNSAVDASFSFTLVTSANGNLVFAGGGPVAANSTAKFLVEVQPSEGSDNCSHGTYAAFNVDFTDGTNTGSAPVPAGATAGNVAPVC